MRIIVTGASGFIGKNLLLKTPSSWEIMAVYNKSEGFADFIDRNKLSNTTPVKCDLTKDIEVKQLFEKSGNDFDVCIYLAANTVVPFSVKNPVSDLQVNTIALLNFLKYYKDGRVIFLSSGAVYDGLSGFVEPGIAISPKIPYAISKLASENYIKFYATRKRAFQYVILRFFGAYGLYEPPRKIYSKLVSTFCLEGKDEFTVYGDGNNLIDAMYIDDAIECVLRVLQGDQWNLTLDLCHGQALTINKLVQRVGIIFGKTDVRINHRNTVDEYIQFRACPEQLEKLFGFRPRVNLEEGLEKLAEHLRRTS